jgi:hypothetical protein
MRIELRVSETADELVKLTDERGHPKNRNPA